MKKEKEKNKKEQTNGPDYSCDRPTTRTSRNCPSRRIVEFHLITYAFRINQVGTNIST